MSSGIATRTPGRRTFPQTRTRFSHVAAAVALAEHRAGKEPADGGAAKIDRRKGVGGSGCTNLVRGLVPFLTLFLAALGSCSSRSATVPERQGEMPAPNGTTDGGPGVEADVRDEGLEGEPLTSTRTCRSRHASRRHTRTGPRA